MWGEMGGGEMKAKAKHPDKALTAVFVAKNQTPGKYADGNGLYLVIDKSGSKRWLLRIVVRGKRTDIGLGGVKLVSLAEAREEALSLRKLARSGGDPLAKKRAQRTTIPSFKEAAELVHAAHSVGWKNPKHTAQWISTLRTYAYPTLKDRRIDQIESGDVLGVLTPRMENV